MNEIDIQNIYKKISTNNYFSNCYRNLARSIVVHFILILIETALNILNILDLILNNFYRQKVNLKYIAPIPLLFKHFSQTTRLFMIIFGVVVFDSMHIVLLIKDFKKKKIYIKIIINFLELFHFRVLLLMFLYLFFSLEDTYFLIGLIFIAIHIYLIINDFLYCHLYYYVPNFINYPYDVFSSLYDIILVYYKILSSLAYYSSNKNIGIFFFVLLLTSRILFCIFFFEKTRNHSYLLMKNTFLNKTRNSSIWIETVIMIGALMVGKDELRSIFFIIVCVCIFFIIVIYIHLLYNPYNFIHIETETPNENLYFYFYSLSNGNSLNYIFEDKIREHFDQCGFCFICKKFVNYLTKNHKMNEEDEKVYFNIDFNQNEENSEDNNNNILDDKNQLIDLFDVIYDGNNKYLHLLKQISDNYFLKPNKFSINNIEYYFINLSFLIYSDYTKYNINLSLNEKLILEQISHNLELLDHQIKIDQLLLCNKFLETCKNVIVKIREILNSEQNFSRAKKLIDLSFYLMELKERKYKQKLFSTKIENITNVKNLILICSIFYEEIFNTVLNNTQIPIRNNFQVLEDAFINNLNKNDKKISLALSLDNKLCKIIRAGKGLSSHINENLFELFPLEFKQYQIEHFTQSIINNFNYNILEKEKEKEKNNLMSTLGVSSYSQVNRRTRCFTRIGNNTPTKLLNFNTNKNIKTKKEFIKIELIICQNIDSKIYYQLVTLKLTPLFNSDFNYFILLDGVNFIHKHVVITVLEQEQNHSAEENIFSISEPKLEFETEMQSVPLKRYKKWLYEQGFFLSKVFSFNTCSKTYYLYMVLSKNKDIRKKVEKVIHTALLETKIMDLEDEPEKSLTRNSAKPKANHIEETASLFSQQLLNSIDKSTNNYGFKNKRNRETEQHIEFNKIGKVAYLMIIINIIVIAVQYIHLNCLKSEIESNNETFLNYREFYKDYFQLFSMVLSISCIDSTPSNCNNIISFYTDIYFRRYPQEKFDIMTFLQLQNHALTLELMEKRNIFNNVYEYIGPERYNKLMRKSVTYLKINKTYVNNELEYNIIEINENFSELLLMMSNNFKYITESNETNTIIYFLNGIDKPFSNFEVKYKKVEINLYQQYIYELIINHKTFSHEFDSINESLKDMLEKRNSIFKLFIYFYLNLNIVIILAIEVVIYIYISYFENILIIILNIINMTLNNKNEELQFNEMFSEKIDNLEVIINLSNESPKQCLRNLNSLYSNYHQFLINKRKKEAREAEKKGHQMNNKSEQKSKKINQSEEVPKSQRILNTGNVRNLRILTKYFIIYIILILSAIALYIFTMLFWYSFFSKEKNLYIILEKDTTLETAMYRAINVYYMMLFNNFTVDYATELLYPEIYNKGEPLTIFKYIYSSMKLGFNNKIEIESLGDLYKNFDNVKRYSCVNLYKENAEEFLEFYTNEVSSSIDIQEKLTNMCVNIIGLDSDKSLYLIENHFQYIKNGIIILDDFTYPGIITHLKLGYLGRVSLFFNGMMTFLINIIYSKRHLIAINRLLNILRSNIQITSILFILYDIILTDVIIFLFIRKVKNYCNQITLLRNTFQISKVEL